MAVQTLPLEVDLTVYASTTLRRVFRWKPDGTNPQDFTGWYGLMLIGPHWGSSVAELSTANGGLTMTADGKVTIQMASAATAALTGQNLFYQLDITDPTAITTRFLRGRVTVVRDVLRTSA